MFKKVKFSKLNLEELSKIESHNPKKEEIRSFYETFDFLELINVWHEIVGEKLCRVTCPLKIKFDSLVVLTKHSIYSQELSYLQEELKQEIFKKFPSLNKILKKIIFQTSESFFNFNNDYKSINKNINRIHPMSPEFRLKKIKADQIFESLDDEEIKKILISIFIQS